MQTGISGIYYNERRITGINQRTRTIFLQTLGPTIIRFLTVPWKNVHKEWRFNNFHKFWNFLPLTLNWNDQKLSSWSSVWFQMKWATCVDQDRIDMLLFIYIYMDLVFLRCIWTIIFTQLNKSYVDALYTFSTHQLCDIHHIP